MAELNGSEQFNYETKSIWSIRYCVEFSASVKIAQITSYTVIMFLSLIGNSFVVAVFYKNKTLRSTVHYFITNMAVSDLIIPVVVLPWLITEAYHDGVWKVDGVMGSILCKLASFSWQVSMIVSILSMVVIAVDRFHSVLFVMRPALISRKTCRCIIAVTWVSSAAIRGPFLHGFKPTLYENRLYCEFNWGSPSNTVRIEKMFLIFWMCFSLISTTALSVMYSSVIIFLYRQKKNLNFSSEIVKKRAKRNRRIAYMLVTVVMVFFASCTPVGVLLILSQVNPEMYFRLPCLLFWFAYYFFGTLYAVVNPVIYYVFNEEYRRGFRKLMCCPWFCSNNSNQGLNSTVPPQVESKVGNGGHTNDAFKNIELQEQ